MTYGKTSPTYYSDPEVQEINRNGARLGTLTQIGARSHIVDTYPILRHISWFTKTLRKWHDDELDLFTRQLDAARLQTVCISIQTYQVINSAPLSQSTKPLRPLLRTFWSVRRIMGCQMMKSHTLLDLCSVLAQRRWAPFVIPLAHSDSLCAISLIEDCIGY